MQSGNIHPTEIADREKTQYKKISVLKPQKVITCIRRVSMSNCSMRMRSNTSLASGVLEPFSMLRFNARGSNVQCLSISRGKNMPVLDA